MISMGEKSLLHSQSLCSFTWKILDSFERKMERQLNLNFLCIVLTPQLNGEYIILLLFFSFLKWSKIYFPATQGCHSDGFMDIFLGKKQKKSCLRKEKMEAFWSENPKVSLEIMYYQ